MSILSVFFPLENIEFLDIEIEYDLSRASLKQYRNESKIMVNKLTLLTLEFLGRFNAILIFVEYVVTKVEKCFKSVYSKDCAHQRQ